MENSDALESPEIQYKDMEWAIGVDSVDTHGFPPIAAALLEDLARILLDESYLDKGLDDQALLTLKSEYMIALGICLPLLSSNFTTPALISRAIMRATKLSKRKTKQELYAKFQKYELQSISGMVSPVFRPGMPNRCEVDILQFALDEYNRREKEGGSVKADRRPEKADILGVPRQVSYQPAELKAVLSSSPDNHTHYIFFRGFIDRLLRDTAEVCIDERDRLASAQPIDAFMVQLKAEHLVAMGECITLLCSNASSCGNHLSRALETASRRSNTRPRFIFRYKGITDITPKAPISVDLDDGSATRFHNSRGHVEERAKVAILQYTMRETRQGRTHPGVQPVLFRYFMSLPLEVRMIVFKFHLVDTLEPGEPHYGSFFEKLCRYLFDTPKLQYHDWRGLHIWKTYKLCGKFAVRRVNKAVRFEWDATVNRIYRGERLKVIARDKSVFWPSLACRKLDGRG